jgi:hypothetical protein
MIKLNKEEINKKKKTKPRFKDKEVYFIVL